MKFTLLVVIAFAAVAQGFVLPLEEVQLNGNVIDNLVREALEYIRGLLKQNEPYTLPAVPQQSIVDPDTGVNLNVQVSNVKISKADDFKVNHIENNLPNLWAKFEVVAPQPHMEGEFTISGRALEKDVSGSGTFSVDLTNMDQSGFIQMGLKNHGLYIANMTVDYNLENAKFSISGLDVSGMSEADINDYLNKNLIPTLNANKPVVCQKVAEQIMAKGNEIMAGKTLKQLIDWLKNLIGH
uniref:Thymidylate kinase n=1 Tax=Lygus hesperus TaxID=30085 RepID=A0A0A9Y176_LYGHE